MYLEYGSGGEASATLQQLRDSEDVFERAMDIVCECFVIVEEWIKILIVYSSSQAVISSRSTVSQILRAWSTPGQLVREVSRRTW